MKAEETRKNLINELNTQLSKTGSFSAMPKKSNELESNFTSLSYGKPKMFEPNTLNAVKITPNTLDIQSVKGIGFKSTGIAPLGGWNRPKEIYDMKELINSNPENMKTFSYDVKTVKAQVALVKRRDWQDILFSDVDWFKPIEFTMGMKKLFKIN